MMVGGGGGGEGQGSRYQHYWSVIICNKQTKKAQYWLKLKIHVNGQV